MGAGDGFGGVSVRGLVVSPPTDWGDLVQTHDDRAFFQAAPDELPAIDIHRL